VTLVVGAVRGDQGVLVADTKVTFGVRDGVVDERERPPQGYASVQDANRAEYRNSVSKIVILDRHLAVGYAGEDPVAKVKHLVELRGCTPEEVLEELAAIPDAHYVVLADGESLRLWQVHEGDADERTTKTGKAWAGDQDAYSVFQGQWSRWPEPMDVEFLASSSMQFPISFGTNESVGGFLTQLRRSHNGLHFVPHPAVIAPYRLELASSDYRGRTLTMQYVVPYGVDPTFTFISACAGAGDTFGASGYVILPAQWGVVFPHDTPWQPVVIHAASVEEFVAKARSDHGQELHGAENPYRLATDD
jgi:hypothetical protein